MIVPFTQTEVETENAQRKRPLPILATIIGLGFGYLFTQLLPKFQGFAALALWPLGIATGLFGVTLVASIVKRQMHWDMLIAGKLLTLVGTVLFFIASL